MERVDSTGTIPEPPVALNEDSERPDPSRFKVVATVAAALFVPQVIVHIVIPVTMLPVFSGMYAAQGAVLPGPSAALVWLGPWLIPLLLVIDGLMFWGFVRLARRYWIGLLFAPLFASSILTGLIMVFIYMPMWQIVTLVE